MVSRNDKQELDRSVFRRSLNLISDGNGDLVARPTYHICHHASSDLRLDEQTPSF